MPYSGTCTSVSMSMRFCRKSYFSEKTRINAGGGVLGETFFKAVLAMLLVLMLASSREVPVANSTIEIVFVMHAQKTTIMMGEEVELELTLRNMGDETFTLMYTPPLFDAFYYDSANHCIRWRDDKAFIQVILKLTLNPGEARTEKLRWSMYHYDSQSGLYTPPTPGTYNLYAQSFTGIAGPILITITPNGPGDLNFDRKVDLADLVIFAGAYSSKPGDPNWKPEADLAEPRNIIGLADLVTFASYYGRTYP